VARYARTQAALKERGVDALFLTGRSNLRYFAGLRDAPLVDGSDLVWSVRSLKSSAEVWRLRKAAEISCRG